MINPGDLALIGTEEGAEMFPPELLAEFEDNSDGALLVEDDEVVSAENKEA